VNARRSRALDAALRAQAPAAAQHAGALSRAQVEACARVFDELERLPAYEEDERRARARSLAAFIARAERGDVQPEARALALAVAARGAAWLAEHPALIPVRVRAWDLALVEAAILSFNARTLGKGSGPAAAVAEEIVEQLIDLEAVLAAGAIEPGEAEELAHAFVTYAHRWLASQPGVLARYQARL
jgi:hypothetical protein